MKVIWRWLVRCWYWDRNNEFRRHNNRFMRALDKRMEYIVRLPLVRREEAAQADPVLRLAKELHEYLAGYSRQTGAI